MLDHAPGFLGRQVQPVFPQVAVLQPAVFGELLAVGDQREESGIAAHQALPGVEDAVVHALDEGAEVQRVAEQGGVVRVDVGLVDAQQGVAEHRRRAVQVGGGEHQHRAVRVDVAVPGLEFRALDLRQVVELQLVAQPAGARRVDALGMPVAEAGRRVERLQRGGQFGLRMLGAIGREEEVRIVDEAGPAAEPGRLVVAESDPVRLGGQLPGAFGADLGGGDGGGAGAQRQPGHQAFEHSGPEPDGKRKPAGRRAVAVRWIRPARRTWPGGRPASGPAGCWRRRRRR
ncbi:hypothetical protein D9M69_314520 [compost metagenome]